MVSLVECEQKTEVADAENPAQNLRAEDAIRTGDKLEVEEHKCWAGVYIFYAGMSTRTFRSLEEGTASCFLIH